MEKKKTIYIFLFVVLILVSSSCHPRRVSDIRPAMTKEEVVAFWGPTNLITYETINDKIVEIWEYHFAPSGSICWITFDQDRVMATGCRPSERGYYSQLGIGLYSEPYYYLHFYDSPYPYFYGGYPYCHPYPPPHHPPPPPHHPPSPPPSPPPHLRPWR